MNVAKEKENLKVAIIGGIGSGKSELLKIAADLGLVCESADSINARLLQSPEYIARIASEFPFAVVDGVVDKKMLAQVVFADDEARQRLNAISHPEIMKRIYESGAQVIEMPLILESGAKDYFDEIVLVSSPMPLRIKHLIGRGMNFTDSVARIMAQTSNKQLKKIATRVVSNAGSLKQMRKVGEQVFADIFEKQAD